MITTPEEHVKRLLLYREGKSDQEIANICFVCTNAIKYWRDKQTPPLPSNKRKYAVLDIRMYLYANGLSDIEIAKAQHCTIMAIRLWRKQRNLTRNGGAIHAGNQTFLEVCASP